MSIPTSWEYADYATHQCIMSPKKDVKIYVMERLSTQHTLEKDIHQACQQIESNFNLKAKQKIKLSNQGDWEKSITIIYQTPISASRMLIGAGNLYQGRAYIVFCDATSSAMSRLQASIVSILESWKPEGFKTTDLNDRTPEPWSEEKQVAFDAFIERARQKLNIPGASIALVERTQGIIYQNSFGVKKLGEDDPVTPDTPFMIGSTTKALTTLMMGMLIDKDLVRWDTPVTSILHDFKLGDMATTKKLALKHTVSASTGMPRRDLDFMFKYSQVTPESRLLEMQSMKPTTKFGETFQYSNYLVMAGGVCSSKSLQTIRNHRKRLSCCNG
ncbi:MAG: serine hydrolase [Legionellaceae bacterium]|nr:serine hydrolase [Legionellaceae bacterium]